MNKAARNFLVIITLLMLSSCGGLRYSQTAPEAKNFHPQSVAIFPADVGAYEEARGNVEQIFSGVLNEKKWFKDVVEAQTILGQIQANEDYRKSMLDYLSRLKQFNISDPELSKKLGGQSKVDSFIVIIVDNWNYARENDEKLGKVGLGLKLIETSTGRIMWKAGHNEAESYWMFRPDLNDMGKDLIKKMIDEMPH